jgi:hypothetical protein
LIVPAFHRVAGPPEMVIAGLLIPVITPLGLLVTEPPPVRFTPPAVPEIVPEFRMLTANGNAAAELAVCRIAAGLKMSPIGVGVGVEPGVGVRVEPGVGVGVGTGVGVGVGTGVGVGVGTGVGVGVGTGVGVGVGTGVGVGVGTGVGVGVVPIPTPSVPWIVAPALLITEPPLVRIIPVVPEIVPEFVTLPKPPEMEIAGPPFPVIKPPGGFLTEPPLVRIIPVVPKIVPEFVTLSKPSEMEIAGPSFPVIKPSEGFLTEEPPLESLIAALLPEVIPSRIAISRSHLRLKTEATSQSDVSP